VRRFIGMNKVRWGVLGTGRIVGRSGVAIHKAENSEWLGVAGRTLENSTEAAKKYNVERAYADYQALIDDPDIDAVYIALLNHLHKEWALKALRAGKHVLIEKPIALTALDAMEMVEEARKQNKL